MFDQSIQRVGFACKYMHPDQSLPDKKLKSIQSQLTERATTNAWLQRQTLDEAHERLWDIVRHNAQAAYNLVQYVGGLPHGQRMVRLGSDQLPFYTHDSWRGFYRRTDVAEYASRAYADVGALARQFDVRMSMHPGQFTVLASDRDDVAERSLEELEYHATIARWMGFGTVFQDFKINVHLSGKRGAPAFIDYKSRMTPELRNMLTIENDEYTSGLRDILALENDFALVFDTHHHMIHSEEFILSDDDRFKRIIESWRGVRPVIHYSVSRDEFMVDVSQDELPDMQILLQRAKRNKLRAHSDYYNHRASNLMVLELGEFADIMCEAKMKNLASQQLFEFRESLKDTV